MGRRFIDFQVQLLGDAVEILFSVALLQQFEKTRHGAELARCQHLGRGLGLAGAGARRRRDQLRLGHELIECLDVEQKFRRRALPRVLHRDAKVGAYARGIAAQHDDPVGELHRFLDVVSDQENALVGIFLSS